MATSSSSFSSPLLGTPYLLSQSPSPSSSTSSTDPSSTTHTLVTPSVCHNLTLFQSLLSRSRQLSDDAITTRLNRAAALSGAAVSGRGARTMGESECAAVWAELTGRWGERNEVLTYCDRVLRGERVRDERGKVKEETGLSADRGDLGRGRRTEEEIKLATLRTALSVESIIRQRSLAAFFSRCPSSALSSSSSSSSSAAGDATLNLPILGTPEERAEEEERRRRARGRDERGNVRWT
ncbi:hypothetical protein JCM8097_008303 [Rhodosporidiobolus ruineniae]